MIRFGQYQNIYYSQGFKGQCFGQGKNYQTD